MPQLGMIRLQLLQPHRPVPRQMQKGILEEARVPVGQHEAVAVEEVRRVRRIAHHVLPQRDADGRHADRAARVAAIELLAQVGDEQAEGGEDERVVGAGVGGGGAVERLLDGFAAVFGGLVEFGCMVAVRLVGDCRGRHVADADARRGIVLIGCGADV